MPLISQDVIDSAHNSRKNICIFSLYIKTYIDIISKRQSSLPPHIKEAKKILDYYENNMRNDVESCVLKDMDERMRRRWYSNMHLIAIVFSSLTIAIVYYEKITEKSSSTKVKFDFYFNEISKPHYKLLLDLNEKNSDREVDPQQVYKRFKYIFEHICIINISTKKHELDNAKIAYYNNFPGLNDCPSTVIKSKKNKPHRQTESTAHNIKELKTVMYTISWKYALLYGLITLMNSDHKDSSFFMTPFNRVLLQAQKLLEQLKNIHLNQPPRSNNKRKLYHLFLIINTLLYISNNALLYQYASSGDEENIEQKKYEYYVDQLNLHLSILDIIQDRFDDSFIRYLHEKSIQFSLIDSNIIFAKDKAQLEIDIDTLNANAPHLPKKQSPTATSELKTPTTTSAANASASEKPPLNQKSIDIKITHALANLRTTILHTSSSTQASSSTSKTSAESYASCKRDRSLQFAQDSKSRNFDALEKLDPLITLFKYKFGENLPTAIQIAEKITKDVKKIIKSLRCAQSKNFDRAQLQHAQSSTHLLSRILLSLTLTAIIVRMNIAFINSNENLKRNDDDKLLRLKNSYSYILDIITEYHSHLRDAAKQGFPTIYDTDIIITLISTLNDINNAQDTYALEQHTQRFDDLTNTLLLFDKPLLQPSYAQSDSSADSSHSSLDSAEMYRPPAPFTELEKTPLSKFDDDCESTSQTSDWKHKRNFEQSTPPRSLYKKQRTAEVLTDNRPSETFAHPFSEAFEDPRLTEDLFPSAQYSASTSVDTLLTPSYYNWRHRNSHTASKHLQQPRSFATALSQFSPPGHGSVSRYRLNG